MSKILRIPLLVTLLFTVACGAARSGDVVLDAGNTGVGLADGIHELQKGVAALSPTPIPATKAKEIQQALLKANEQLGRLPDFLEAADAARKVGQVQPGQIEQTIAIIASISDQLNIVVGGLDIGEVASKMLQLAAKTRATAAQISAGLAQLRAEIHKE